MDSYITGAMIKRLSENKNMTQQQLAEKLNVTDEGCEIKKLYAEGNAEARFKIRRTKYLLYYCNVHGLFKVRV